METRLKKPLVLSLAVAAALFGFCGCAGTSTSSQVSIAPIVVADEPTEDIDYMVMVNKQKKVPQDWEESISTITVQNSLGEEVTVEEKAYDAYEALKSELEDEEIYIDLDSAFRSVSEQKQLVEELTQEYGPEYVAQYVAVPGYSEHHTGLALDLYLNVDGQDIVENEELVQYTEIWDKVHSKLAEHGFILRYLEGKEAITGYAYEPWHIRYIDDVSAAKKIMDENVTLEEYQASVIDARFAAQTATAPSQSATSAGTSEQL